MPFTRTQLFWLNVSLVAAWAGVIWMLGGHAFGYDDTSRVIGPLLDWLFPSMQAADKRFWLRFVRKAAHVGEYAVFAVLVLRLALFVAGREIALAGRSLVGRPLGVHIGLALAATLVLALLDEGRQSNLFNRTSSIYDVGLDLTGGTFGVVLAISLATLARRPLLGVPGWPGSSAARPSVLREP